MKPTLLLMLGASVLTLSSTPLCANNTPLSWINVIDYGADPSPNPAYDDAVAIRNAFAAVTSTNRVVYFPAGTYDLWTSLDAGDPANPALLAYIPLIGVSDITIIGDGSGTILQGAPATGNYVSTDPAILSFVNGTNIYVNNLRIVGAGKTEYSEDTQGGSAIYAGHSQVITVRNCNLIDANCGIYAYQTSWSKFEMNTISGRIVQDGIHIRAYDGVASFNVVMGNSIDGGELSTVGMGIRLDAKFTTTAHNVIRGTILEPIVVEGRANEFLAVQGNLIENTHSGYGIELRHASYGVVQGNAIKGGAINLRPLHETSTREWKVSGNVVNANVVHSSPGNGFYLGIGSANETWTVRNNMISANMIFAPAETGIHVASESRTEKNMLNDNYIVEAGGIGVSVNANDIQVHDNYIDRPGQHGLWSYAASTNMSVVGNRFLGINDPLMRPLYAKGPNSTALHNFNADFALPEKISYDDSLHLGRNGGALRLRALATAPSSPLNGDIYLDSSDNTLRVFDGTSWRTLQYTP